ncbi:Low conductance mechanosensitive channel YnaI [bacterium HR33]|nr:Low conductance mechanosensitive channel YnaI [bacterium HR33]
MQFFENRFLGNSVADWTIAVTVWVLGSAALRMLKGGIQHRLQAIAARTQNEIDDLLADVVARTRTFFLIVVGFYLGSRFVDLPERLNPWVHGLLVVGIFLQIALWGNGVIAFYVSRITRKKLAEDPATATTVSALRFLGQLVLWTAVLLLALDNLGVEITPLLTGLGVGGIAVALAVQNILGDLFASLSIVLDKPFVIGDFIIVGEHLGTVEHIGLKTTRVRSLWGEQLVFANSDLLNSRIRNFKRMYQRRVVFAVGVVYQTPADVLEKIPGWIREIVQAQPLARFDRAHLKGFGPSSLDFEVVYWVQDPDYNKYMDIQQAINLEIIRKFAAEGVEFAYPTQTLYLHKAEVA